MEWDGVTQTLHHRIKEAGVPPVFHSKTDPLVLVPNGRSLHQLVNQATLTSLNIAFEITFILFTLFTFLFELLSTSI